MWTGLGRLHSHKQSDLHPLCGHPWKPVERKAPPRFLERPAWRRGGPEAHPEALPVRSLFSRRQEQGRGTRLLPALCPAGCAALGERPRARRRGRATRGGEASPIGDPAAPPPPGGSQARERVDAHRARTGRVPGTRPRRARLETGRTLEGSPRFRAGGLFESHPKSGDRTQTGHTRVMERRVLQN